MPVLFSFYYFLETYMFLLYHTSALFLISYFEVDFYIYGSVVGTGC